MYPYDPHNWYWKSKAGKVYGSAADKVLAGDDAGYGKWVAAGNYATAWPRDTTGVQTDAALLEVLQPYGLGKGLQP